MADIFRSALGIFGGTKADSDFVGQRVDIGSVQLRVKKLIAEGAYGFVFVAQDVATGKDYALKRLMAADEPANKAIIQEISFMKRLRGHPNIVQFLNAASIGADESDHGMSEFLILTELCTGGQLIKWFNERQGKSIPSNQVLRIFHQICRAVSHMHKQNPPIIHRDLKIENLLLSSRGQIKLCDFGSATTKSLYPTESWSSVERSLVEDEIQRNTTPMYRAPEMVDLYSNYQITVKSDVWALGCLLYMLCYMDHPFEDGAKLRILNAKFTLPEFDKEYGVFHDLIHKMLQVDPVKRPDISEIITNVEGIALSRYVELKGSVFQGEESFVPAGQDQADQSSVGNAVFGGVVKGAGSFFSNIKDMSSKMVQSVAGYVKSDLDISYITSRILVMPIPGEGIESTYKNSVDDVQVFLDTKHPSRFAIINLSQRPTKLKGKVFDCDWSPKRAPPLGKILIICRKIVAWLKCDKKNVVAIQCQDGKLTSGLLVTSLFLYCHLFMSPECAFEMFNVRRQNMSTSIVPNPSQKHYFNYITRLVNDPDVKPHKCFVSINAMTMEPVPLFNKARKGCRPFIEVYNGDKRVLTTAREIERMREYAVSDPKIGFKLDLELQGDVTVCVYHGRSTLGGKVQGKLTSIPMFQLQFHSGFIGKDATKMVFIKEDIDIHDASNSNRFAENFNVTLNICVDESRCNDITYVWESSQNEKPTRQLLFTTSEEYLQCQEDFVLGDDREMSYREQFELDKKSRQQNANQRGESGGNSCGIRDKQTEASKTREGSFFKNLNWQEDEPLKENSMSDDDSDIDWQAVRDSSKPNNDDPPSDKGGVTFDFFTESKEQGTRNVENIDLFNFGNEEKPSSKDDGVQDHPEADLLGLGLDNGNPAEIVHDSNANLPSPKSRQDTRHSSLGSEQLHTDFDLLNLSHDRAAEEPGTDLLNEAPNTAGMKRNKSADDILIHTPSDHLVSDDDFFDALHKPSNNSTASNSFDPFAGLHVKRQQNVDLLGNLDAPASRSGKSSPILTPEVSVPQNKSNPVKPPKADLENDPFADLGGFGSQNGFGKSGNKAASNTTGASFGKTSSPKPSAKGFQNGSVFGGKTAATKPASKPNYAPSYSTGSSSVFGNYGLKDSYVNKQVGKDEFSDILNSHGFKPASESGPTTMNSLRKQTQVDEDPVKAKVRSWSEGKRKNIRALLCSLDTVLWEGEDRWKKVGMHELVNADQVKKCYRRAVLSVHPDKRIGSPEEHLARAIFVELNESWAAFEASGSKSLY